MGYTWATCPASKVTRPFNSSSSLKGVFRTVSTETTCRRLSVNINPVLVSSGMTAWLPHDKNRGKRMSRKRFFLFISIIFNFLLFLFCWVATGRATPGKATLSPVERALPDTQDFFSLGRIQLPFFVGLHPTVVLLLLA